MFGMLITSMIALAVAGLTRAVSTDWLQSEAGQSVDLQAALVSSRLENLLREAKYVGLVRPGSLDGSAVKAGAVVLWLSDSTGVGTMTLPEIAMIQHDPTTKTLYLYQVKFPSSYTAAQIAAASVTITYATLCGSTAPEDFRALAFVSGQPLARNVTGFKVAAKWLTAWPQKPAVDYELKIFQAGVKDSSGTQQTPDRVQYQYGTAVLRAPTQPS